MTTLMLLGIHFLQVSVGKGHRVNHWRPMKLKLYNEITIQDNKVVKVEKSKSKAKLLVFWASTWNSRKIIQQ
jgi:hypothetical protein